MTKNPRDIIVAPVVSEKSYDLIEKANTYTFVVDRRSNKSEIKDAIQDIFSVSVVSVNTQNRIGKVKRTGRVLGGAITSSGRWSRSPLATASTCLGLTE